MNNHCTIYLVDDEKWHLDILNKTIPWRDVKATVIGYSTSSTKAFTEILTLQPDIVISDIRMPDMDGLSLIEKLKDNNCNASFIILSGYGEFSYAKKAMKFGVDHYCLKPVDTKELMDAIISSLQSVSDKQLLSSLSINNPKSHSENLTFNAIKNYVYEHFHQDLKLQEIADEFYLNASYLSSLFKKESGSTFRAYLNNLRMNYACDLITKTELTITDIAHRCGFNNYVYFTRVFKEKNGMTPTQYREKSGCN